MSEATKQKWTNLYVTFPIFSWAIAILLALILGVTSMASNAKDKANDADNKVDNVTIKIDELSNKFDKITEIKVKQ
jgi:hypothetical protein